MLHVSLAVLAIALDADPITWYGFLALAAVAWIAIAAGWAARFVPIYLSPRSDGRDG